MIHTETKDGQISVQLVGSSHELILEASAALARLTGTIAPLMAAERSCSTRDAELELLEDLHGMALARLRERHAAEGEICSESKEMVDTPAEAPKRRRRSGGSCPVS